MANKTRVALVTGAAKRLGRAIALELAASGCDVAVHYCTSAPEADEVVNLVTRAGRRAIAVSADLSERDSPRTMVERVCAELGGLDVLVNNASVFEADPPGGFDFDHWQAMLTVNALAPAALIEAAAGPLTKSGNGKVINLADISAERPWRTHVAYCASKAALVSLTKAYARRLAPRVQVNGVSPGIAIFPEEYSPGLRGKLIDRVPLKRAGEPRDVAALVRFLVDTTDYITGQIINVDGGRSIV